MKITKRNKAWWEGSVKCTFCMSEYDLEQDDRMKSEFSMGVNNATGNPVLRVTCPVCECCNFITYKKENEI